MELQKPSMSGVEKGEMRCKPSRITRADGVARKQKMNRSLVTYQLHLPGGEVRQAMSLPVFRGWWIPVFKGICAKQVFT